MFILLILLMLPEKFFELFAKELEVHTEMQGYYKYLEKRSYWHFRRNYFLERLRYVKKYIVDAPVNIEGLYVWDCGCGYGTVCLYLAMNGIKTYGTTLEFYYDSVQKRKEYWSQYGDTSLFTCSYEYLFDNHPKPGSYDWIIVQDTLHHLEPIADALQIFKKSLKANGKILAVEENGNNIMIRLQRYKDRGNNLIISMWDEKLQKNILIGNENIRSLANWQQLFEKNGFYIQSESVQYIRYFPPLYYRFSNPDKLLQLERNIQLKKGLRREYLFFGVNFVGSKIVPEELANK